MRRDVHEPTSSFGANRHAERWSHLPSRHGTRTLLTDDVLLHPRLMSYRPILSATSVNQKFPKYPVRLHHHSLPKSDQRQLQLPEVLWSPSITTLLNCHRRKVRLILTRVRLRSDLHIIAVVRRQGAFDHVDPFPAGDGLFPLGVGNVRGELKCVLVDVAAAIDFTREIRQYRFSFSPGLPDWNGFAAFLPCTASIRKGTSAKLTCGRLWSKAATPMR